MKRTIAFGLIGATALALVACKTAEQSLQEAGAKPLSAAELKTLFSKDIAWSWKNVKGRSGKTAVKTDGTVVLTSGDWTSPGKWRLNDNTLCTTYEKLADRGEKCFRFYRTDTDAKTFTLVYPDGSKSGTITLEH